MASVYQIRDVVPKGLVTIAETKNVQEAAKLMHDENRGDLVVVSEGGTPVGIITERDVTFKVAALGLPASEVSVRSTMSSPILTIPANFTLDEAVQMMAQKELGRLLVVDDNVPIGLLTEMDILAVQQKCGYCFKEVEAVSSRGEVVVICSCRTKYHKSCTETIVHCVYCGSTLVHGVVYPLPEETTGG